MIIDIAIMMLVNDIFFKYMESCIKKKKLINIKI